MCQSCPYMHPNQPNPPILLPFNTLITTSRTQRGRHGKKQPFVVLIHRVPFITDNKPAGAAIFKHHKQEHVLSLHPAAPSTSFNITTGTHTDFNGPSIIKQSEGDSMFLTVDNFKRHWSNMFMRRHGLQQFWLPLTSANDHFVLFSYNALLQTIIIPPQQMRRDYQLIGIFYKSRSYYTSIPQAALTHSKSIPSLGPSTDA